MPSTKTKSPDLRSYSLADLQSARIALERTRYQQDFWAFATELLGYNAMAEVPHREVVSFLLSPDRFKLVLLPRGSFKSTIFSIAYPMWRFTSNPNLRVLIDSRTVERSKMFLSEIKQHIERNERFRELFGNWKDIPGWREQSLVLPTRSQPLKEPSIQTGGIDSPVTGGHYEIIIVDDLMDETNSQTEIQRRKAILHFKTLFPILEPTTGIMNVIGTRWAEGDVYQHILDTENVERQ